MQLPLQLLNIQAQCSKQTFFIYFSSCDGDSILVPDTSDSGIGGCFVSFRGRPRWPEIFCLDPGGLLGDLWAEALWLGLAGGLTDDVFDDDDLLGGLVCDLENVGDENNPCLAEI